MEHTGFTEAIHHSLLFYAFLGVLSVLRAKRGLLKVLDLPQSHPSHEIS